MPKPKLIPVCLKNPNFITLHYSDKQFNLQLDSPLSNQILLIEEKHYSDIKPYLSNPQLRQPESPPQPENKKVIKS